jgi:hypothetical protein
MYIVQLFAQFSATVLGLLTGLRMWARSYKPVWTFPGSMDISPIILGQYDGGRGCPSATNLWTRAVFDVLEQCASLPGEVSRIVRCYW